MSRETLSKIPGILFWLLIGFCAGAVYAVNSGGHHARKNYNTQMSYLRAGYAGLLAATQVETDRDIKKLLQSAMALASDAYGKCEARSKTTHPTRPAHAVPDGNKI